MSPLNAALAALVAREAEQAGALAKTRAALDAVREMLGVAPSAVSAPAPRPATKVRKMKVPEVESGSSKGDQVKDAIRAALKRGPLTTVELADKLDSSKSGIGYHVRQMKEDGVVVFVGAGRASKVALAGTPAKEAP